MLISVLSGNDHAQLTLNALNKRW